MILTYTLENYLEAIFELIIERDTARLSDVATRLNVSKASANRAMQLLAAQDLVIAEKYKTIILTTKGQEYAKLTATKHHAIKHFFVEQLGINPDRAEIEACAIEHVVSEDTVNALNRYVLKHLHCKFK
ncbi:MAG: metal-dependent transcriptional regulator [bacterium]|jgi:DtxR family Mn-dependent transcriptional regulator|nr:metal-dependent transcriptional regulator [bacterium]